MNQKSKSIQIKDKEQASLKLKSNFQMEKQPSLNLDQRLSPLRFQASTSSEINKWEKIQKLINLAKKEPCMNYKDYIFTRQFFQTDYQQLKQFLVKREQGVIQPPSSSLNPLTVTQKQNNQQLHNKGQKVAHQLNKNEQSIIMTQNFMKIKQVDSYHIALILAKCYFMLGQYQKCIEAIENLVPLTNSITFKLLYQRQMLLFKAVHLFYLPKQFVPDMILEQYFEHRTKCIDWLNHKNYVLGYDGELNNLLKKTQQSVALSNQNINHKQQSKFISQFCSLYKNNTFKVFSGFPVYIISKFWIQRAQKYVQNPSKSTYPGSPLNFQILNHIFQFQSHANSVKNYMNTILFPLTQNIDYYIVSSKAWKQLQAKFGGIPVKRFPSKGENFTKQIIGDTLIKTIISYKSKLYFFQWQMGTHWQHSIIPYLNRAYFKFDGPAQMKILQQQTNENQIAYQEVEIGGMGLIQQRKCIYKYYEVNTWLRKRINKQLLNRLIKIYDMEDYSLKSQNIKDYSMAIISMKNIKESVAKFSQQIQNKNNSVNKNEIKLEQQKTNKNTFKKISNEMIYASQYLACIIHCISNLEEISTLFVTNKFVSSIRTDCNDQSVQFCIAFAHLLKQLWFSDSLKGSVDTQSFIKALFNYRMMQKTLNCNRKPTDIKMIQQIILNLHMILNLGEGAKQIMKFPIFNTIQPLKAQCIPYFHKINKSPICQGFKQFHYQIFTCVNCFSIIGYKLNPTLTINVKIPEYEQYLKLFFVSNPKVRKNSIQTKSQSVRQILNSGCEKYGKIVRQMNFKLRRNKTLSHIYTLIAQKYNLNLQSSSNQLITMIVDEQAQYFHQIYTSKDMGKKDISIKWINKLLYQSNQAQKVCLYKLNIKQNKAIKNKKFIVFTFLVTQPVSTKELVVVTFRTPGNQSTVNGFPELIKIPRQNLTQLEFKSNEGGKKILKSLLSNSEIQIQKYQTRILNRGMLEDNNLTIKKQINIYTSTKLWLVERSLNPIVIEDRQDQMVSKQQITLQECLKSSFCNESGLIIVDRLKERDKQYQQKNQQIEQVRCYQCKKQVNPIVQTKILYLSRILIFTMSMQQSQTVNKPRTKIKFPLTDLNMRPYLRQSSKAPLIYNLKAAIILQKNLYKNSGLKQSYYCIAQNCINNRWYQYKNQCVKQIDVEQIEFSGVEVLIYQRDDGENGGINQWQEQ